MFIGYSLDDNLVFWLILITLSFELSTTAAWGGIRTMWWGSSIAFNGKYTLAGRFKFNTDNSASSREVLASLVGWAPNFLPIDIRARTNSSSDDNLGAWQKINLKFTLSGKTKSLNSIANNEVMRRPPRKSGSTPKPTETRVVLYRSIVSIVFWVNPLLLRGLHIVGTIRLSCQQL